jgi:Na+/H+ antiporter NhaC
MALHNYLPRQYREKRYSKSWLYVGALFWLAYIVVFALIYIKQPVIKVLFALLGAINLTGTLYQLKNGLYLKSGEKYSKGKTIPPEEFLAKVKKEVGHGNSK